MREVLVSWHESWEFDIGASSKLESICETSADSLPTPGSVELGERCFYKRKNLWPRAYNTAELTDKYDDILTRPSHDANGQCSIPMPQLRMTVI